MGNDTKVRFVFREEERIKKLEDLKLDKLLTAVVGDIYSKAKLAEIVQNMISSARTNKHSRIDVRVGDLYWFGVSVYLEDGVDVGLLVEDYHMLNEPAMSDFSQRVHSAFKVIKPWYGYAETDESIDALREDYGSEVKPDAHVCWLNYYSPKLVDEIGRDKLLSAARTTAQSFGDVTIDELADRAIILQVGKMPGYIENLPKFKAIEKSLFGKPCKYDAKRA